MQDERRLAHILGVLFRRRPRALRVQFRHVTKPMKGERVIVSLTTLPHRIANLRPTLRSLLRQTRIPDEIVISIPRSSVRQDREYVVPRFLRRYPRVRLLHTDRDWGPATKFIPTVQEELATGRADTLVVVVDDDRAYPRDTIAAYVHHSRELPCAALCFRGAAMPATLDWRDAQMIYGNLIDAPVRVDVITGCGSYAVRPKFFDAAFWNYAGAPAAAFYMDDIWISGHLARRGVECVVVPCVKMMRTVLRQLRTMSLHDVPGGRQPNNNELIGWFRSKVNVFEPSRIVAGPPSPMRTQEGKLPPK